MAIHQETITLSAKSRGFHLITHEIEKALLAMPSIENGLLHLFIQHTSASMVISESYDPSARIDLEGYMDRLAPENQAWFRHTMEGSDDSPSHMRAMLTDTSLSFPIDNGQLSLGTWQGVYLFEHRRRGHHRQVLLRCLSVE